MTALKLDERRFVDELRLLVRTRWVGFAAGEDLFARLTEE
jgi:hypothetical protein